MLPHEDNDIVAVIHQKDESPKRPDGDEEEHCGEEVVSQSVYEVSDEQNVKEIKVLLCKNLVRQRIFTIDMPLLCNELDLVTEIFKDSIVLEDNDGYQIFNGETKQRAEVFAVNDPRIRWQYKIDVQDTVKSSNDCPIVVTDDDDSPQEIKPPTCPTPKSVDSDETYFEEVSLEGKVLNQQEDEKFHSCLDAKNDIYVSESQKISCLKTENDSRDIKENIKISCSDAEDQINLSQNNRDYEDLFAILSQDEPVEKKPVVLDDYCNDDKEDIVAGAENTKSSDGINTSRFYSQGKRELQSSSSQSRKTVQLSDSPNLSQRKSSRETSSSPRNSILAIYPLPPARGGITIYKENYKCLGDGEYLNDVIIDFYLKYLMNEVLSENDRKRTHVFSSQFYTRLSKPDAAAGNDETVVMTESERRHLGVQRWTKNINIFEKDFIIVPINEHLHWNLAMICFPGLVGMLEEDTETLYRPCILFFDSLCNKNKDRIAAILRGYLRQEYLAKTGEEKKFTNSVLKVRYPRIPKQPNATDCGLYVLQYVEQFFKSPIEDYTVVPINLSEWFHRSVIKRKRAEIATLVAELARKYRPERDVVMPNLQFPSDTLSSDEEDLETRWTKNPYHKDTPSSNGTTRRSSRVAGTCASAVSKVKKSDQIDLDELMDGVRDAPTSDNDEHNLSLDMVTFKNSDQSDSMDITEDDNLIDDHNTTNSKRDKSLNRASDWCNESSFKANSSKYKYSNGHKISIIKEDFSGTKSHIFNRSSIFSNGSGEHSISGLRPKRESRTKSKSEQMTELKDKFQARKRKKGLKEGVNNEKSKSKSFKWIDTSVFESNDKFSVYNADDDPGIPPSTAYKDYKIHNKRLEES